MRVVFKRKTEKTEKNVLSAPIIYDENRVVSACRHFFAGESRRNYLSVGGLLLSEGQGVGKTEEFNNFLSNGACFYAKDGVYYRTIYRKSLFTTLNHIPNSLHWRLIQTWVKCIA